jgi:hypothetical protein
MSYLNTINKKYNEEKASSYPIMTGYLVFKDNSKLELEGDRDDLIKVMNKFDDGKNPVKSLTYNQFGKDVPEDEAYISIKMDGKQTSLDSAKEVNDFLKSIASSERASTNQVKRITNMASVEEAAGKPKIATYAKSIKSRHKTFVDNINSRNKKEFMTYSKSVVKDLEKILKELDSSFTLNMSNKVREYKNYSGSLSTFELKGTIKWPKTMDSKTVDKMINTFYSRNLEGAVTANDSFADSKNILKIEITLPITN